MSLLATQGLPSFNQDAFVGTSTFGRAFSSEDNIHTEDYTPNVVTVTQGFENIGFDYSGATLSHNIHETYGECQHNVNFSSHFGPEIDHEEAADDRQAASFANFENDDSKPNEVEFPIPALNPEDDVYINVMVETLAAAIEGMSLGHQAPLEAPLPPTENDQMLYCPIPFFA